MSDKDIKEEDKKKARRKLLKSAAVGGGVIGTLKAAPENWTKPVIGSLVLPSHADHPSDKGVMMGADDSSGNLNYPSV